MVIWEKKFHSIYPSLPGSLLAVLVGTLVAMLLPAVGLSGTMDAEHFVNLPDVLHQDGPVISFGIPTLSMFQNLVFYKVAGTIAIVASLESLLSIEAIEKLDPHRHRVNGNRELIAQGVGNTVSGLWGIAGYFCYRQGICKYCCRCQNKMVGDTARFSYTHLFAVPVSCHQQNTAFGTCNSTLLHRI